MADHRDGPRLVNSLFPVFQQLPPRQQAIMTHLLGVSPPGDVRGLVDERELDEELAEARQHFLTKLQDASGA